MTSLWKYLLVKWRKLFAITPEEKYPAMNNIQREYREAFGGIVDQYLISYSSDRKEKPISFARKLIKVTTNALILNVVDKERIIQFAREHAYLSRRLKVSAENKFELEKKSAQNLFIQLLDDAFLHSELSSNDYLSPGKDILRPEEVPDAQ